MQLTISLIECLNNLNSTLDKPDKNYQSIDRTI